MSRIDEEYNIRREKAEKLRATDINPYPARVPRSHDINAVITGHTDFIKENKTLSIVGRVRGVRVHGASTFVTISDDTGILQVYIKKDEVGVVGYEQFQSFVDIGDGISVTGALFYTKRGELTVLAQNWAMAYKALLPLPEKWHGLSDVEIRYRQRYLDLIANDEVKRTFIQRAILIKTIRSYVESAGFLEVDTPMLQPIPGGATARPFVTHHNALDTDLYLRVAPELYLKRLIVGGFGKVYEIARCFRNEGIDRDHNPEFTQIELYAAYWDYEMMMEFTEGLFVAVSEALHNSLTITADGNDITFAPPFKRITFRDAIKHYAGVDIDITDDIALRKVLQDFNASIDQKSSRAKLLDELFKVTVRSAIIAPTFIINYPVELSPLAKKVPGNERYVERFQLIAAKRELCNAFTELNDPIDQRERFKNQEAMRADGDDEAQRIDEDFITALEHGMPPTSGIGIGIDRLTALMTDSHNLKEVILFPTLKPKTDHEDTH